MRATVLALLVLAGCAALPNAEAPPGTHRVALTFDDGPAPPWTGQILDCLRAAGVRATFFVVGANVERHPGVARRIVAEGHEIANHTYRHLSAFSVQTTATMIAEADAGESAITAATGRRPRLVRYPIGIAVPNGPRARRAAAARERVIVSSSGRAHDCATTDAPRTIADRVLALAHDGAILALHDGHAAYRRTDQSATVAALPMILAGLKERGLTPVPVGELLGEHPYRASDPAPAASND